MQFNYLIKYDYIASKKTKKQFKYQKLADKLLYTHRMYHYVLVIYNICPQDLVNQWALCFWLEGQSNKYNFLGTHIFID